jgi:hypothetical protein
MYKCTQCLDGTYWVYDSDLEQDVEYPCQYCHGSGWIKFYIAKPMGDPVKALDSAIEVVKKWFQKKTE